jgi:hypothetical protein
MRHIKVVLLLWLIGCDAPSEDDGAGTTTSPDSTDSQDSQTTTAGDPTTDPSAGDGDFPSQGCDMLAQNCPDGYKCGLRLEIGFVTACVPVLGDGQPGEVCTIDLSQGTDDCGATSVCVNYGNVDAPEPGICRAFCSGSSDDPQCDPGHTCKLGNFGGISATCERLCDPLVPTCEAGLGCYFFGGLPIYVDGDFLCDRTYANDPLGEVCADGTPSACSTGNFCIEEYYLPACDGAFCCTTYCDPQQGGVECAGMPGTTCQPFTEAVHEVPVEYQHVGACVSP